MPAIDLSILNQRQTPAFYADVFANRPAAGFVGRIFVSTNTFAFYRDNGTGWDLIGGPGTGTITGSGASGQIALWDGASTITGDTGLTYNGTDNSLTASKFIVTGGTSSQFLKADGSVDSSSYVPYTGATTSLNMGANNISGQNYFINGNGVNNGGYLAIKQYSGTSSGSQGYTSLYAALQNSLYINYSQTNGSIKTAELSSALLGTTPRQFQFPDADGTLALTSNIPSVSGAVGQVSYFNGTNSITGSNDLFWDSVNGHLGIGTNVPGTALDVHHDQPTVAILNQTVATNDVRIGFQNNGVGLWRIGAFYNAGANDFGIYDAVASIQPVTVKKTTGQVLIGTSTVGSGKLVVASATGDNGIQIVGATAPSLRIDSAESGPTKRAGLGISTATNNFIQGSADRDFCIFNGSTTASPMLFGIYDAGAVNVQEAARISAARNFLIGKTTDSGEKLQVNGTGIFTANNVGLTVQSLSSTGYASLTMDADFRDYVIGVGGSAASVTETRNSFYVYDNTAGSVRFYINSAGAATFVGSGLFSGNLQTNGVCTIGNQSVAGHYYLSVTPSTTTPILLQGSLAGVGTAPISLQNGGGNILLGTTTDNGYRLNVNGSIFTNSTIGIENPTNGAPSQVIVSNSVNGQGSGKWRTYTRTILATGTGTKLNIPFVNQGSLNIVTLARVTVCSADFNSAFGPTATFTFSVGSLTALSNLSILQSGGAYVSATTSGMNVVVTLSSFSAAYIVIEYLTAEPAYSIDLANITLTS